MRKISAMICFSKLYENNFMDLSSNLGHNGYGLTVGLKCLFLQFFYDLSDRELEDRLHYDMSFRWFCGLGLTEQSPDHSFFCRIRKLFGTKRTAQVFSVIRDSAVEQNIIRGVFHFVDSTVIKSKETAWEQRDKALLDNEKELNNSNIHKYNSDKDTHLAAGVKINSGMAINTVSQWI